MKKVTHVHRWSNWWRVKRDSSMERLCLTCGEVQSVGKVNKVVMGYALSNNKNGIACYTAQMPIYWNKNVAKREAEKRNNNHPLKRVKVVVY